MTRWPRKVFDLLMKKKIDCEFTKGLTSKHLCIFSKWELLPCNTSSTPKEVKIPMYLPFFRINSTISITWGV